MGIRNAYIEDGDVHKSCKLSVTEPSAGYAGALCMAEFKLLCCTPSAVTRIVTPGTVYTALANDTPNYLVSLTLSGVLPTTDFAAFNHV
jgi:hypothetical protein